jgi:hypothetical protein
MTQFQVKRISEMPSGPASALQPSLASGRFGGHRKSRRARECGLGAAMRELSLTKRQPLATLSGWNIRAVAVAAISTRGFGARATRRAQD